ncbi:MAG: hypothetical protein KIT58_18510 [Planctomycetota bacterium]|nr:hypothetical protein [Planctomycetota bacterium]
MHGERVLGARQPRVELVDPLDPVRLDLARQRRQVPRRLGQPALGGAGGPRLLQMDEGGGLPQLARRPGLVPLEEGRPRRLDGGRGLVGDGGPLTPPRRW